MAHTFYGIARENDQGEPVIVKLYQDGPGIDLVALNIEARELARKGQAYSLVKVEVIQSWIG